MPIERPKLRELFLQSERRLEVFFYTSSLPKFLHAATVFARSGISLKQFRSKTDPYAEDYDAGKERLLMRAVTEIVRSVGSQSLLFVEDTSLRIEGLSSSSEDSPGLAVKEWFAATTFEELSLRLDQIGRGRRAVVKSDIALHVPGLPRPVFFHGETPGTVADEPPAFAENDQYPWLTPTTFNGWFVPDGSTKALGAMSLEESWRFDFRTQALEQLIDRLEEYAASLNLPSNAYSRVRPVAPSNQLLLLKEHKPVLIVVGKTCAGKTTFGQRGGTHKLQWAEASGVLRTFRSAYDEDGRDDYQFAKDTLETKGADVVARKVLQLFDRDLDDGLVVTGFRTIEELEVFRTYVPRAEVVLVESSERTRFRRHRLRGRLGAIKTLAEFREHDLAQWRFGLLRVAEEFADVKIENEGTLDEFFQQVDFLIESGARRPFPGISRRVFPRHSLEHNQLFRCLNSLVDAGRPLACDEIQDATSRTGIVIRDNNANKVLKRVPELATRFELAGTRVRYEVTNAGRAYVRYTKVRFSV